MRVTVEKGGKSKRVLVLGATGMSGHVVFFQLSARDGLEVYGTVRDLDEAARWFSPEMLARCLRVDAFNFDSVIRALGETQPEVVINCLGIIKQSSQAKDPFTSIYLNALLPCFSTVGRD